ncbi:MAG: hypothetical protein OXT09_23825 [Myxococcales bacterium]|nr:hypothetical protein [Myxococcales bacterium]
MNAFHAVQYLGLVWARERNTMIRLFRLTGRSYAAPVALILFLGLTGLYGLIMKATSNHVRIIWSITTTVSLMHFWYDGFIWSVRKGQV